MKASELRIGSFVEYNGMTLRVSEIYSPKPRQPKEFSDVECVELHCDGFIAATIHEINPIELTEEILVKCGFKKEDVVWDYYSHEYITGLFTYYNGGLLDYSIDSNTVCGVTYLHS